MITDCAAAEPAPKVLPARVPPPPGQFPVRIGAVADLGENCYRPGPDGGGCGNATIAALAAGAAAGDFDAIIHAGDIACVN